MIFEWDDQKARRNIAKHDVAFELACRVWDDPKHLLLPDRIVDGEERWHAIGLVDGIAILVVVHAYPDHADETCIRLISARKATAHERHRYETEAFDH
ncbi:BrnT family toxin [Ferrovibrio terrae]|uniref:BrnT family toxin n=1 Tax=Ferrovibrio terrae TaxID=2594003 RepID=UPI003137F4E0